MQDLKAEIDKALYTIMGKRGIVQFPDQKSAEAYLRALPYPYSGETANLDCGRWAVRYRRNATDVGRGTAQ
jgi:hypothetical protein